jgi:hypothetical protein
MPKRKELGKGTDSPPLARQGTFTDNPNGEMLRELQAKGKDSTVPIREMSAERVRNDNRIKEKLPDHPSQRPEASVSISGIRDNYDIQWNPVRIIQRFGRIDRIGSINTTVQLVNFWPTQDLNKYINLKNRVEARMALADIAATQEDNILNVDELQELITDDLKYRDKQFLRLKDEMLDLEDFNESVALSEFTLDDFRIELMKYIEANRTQLEQSPLGLYAVVPTHLEYTQIATGVIFCLKQLGETSGNETVNPLQPYFLVYIRDDSVVRYTFAQPKQILEIYRLLCTEKSTPYEALCNLFDQETKNGANMTRYSELLQKAVESLVHTFKKRALTGLLSGRGGVLVEAGKQVTSTSDFQLITWLVIKDSEKSPLP